MAVLARADSRVPATSSAVQAATTSDRRDVEHAAAAERRRGERVGDVQAGRAEQG